jgi:hypothetical protein
MLLSLCQRLQASELSVWLAGSTWAVPLIGALHVLGIAWFGGGVLLSIIRRFDRELRFRSGFVWTGAACMTVTGALLFITEPVRCVSSLSFLAKMLLLAALIATSRVRTKVPAALSLAMWAGVLLAARGIAYF